MNICPITYERIQDGELYSLKGLHKLSPHLNELKLFPYTSKEQRQEAANLAGKMSIQGIQPKLSVCLNLNKKVFEIAPIGGRYILKPASVEFPELPENEDLSMRLASKAKIKVPIHGLIYSKEREFSYLIKRFDRYGQNKKYHVEDFAQLSGKTRDTKYDSSMENISDIIEEYATFPLVEKMELFKRTIFNFLIGNEDMHLKNYSLINIDNIVALSPAYDLLSSTLVLEDPIEEIALPLNGKKNKLRRYDLVDYYGGKILNLNSTAINKILAEFKESFYSWERIIDICFLSQSLKIRYKKVIASRMLKLKL